MEKDPVVIFSPALKGAITLSDLLTSQGTLQFVTDKHTIQSGGFLFQVLYHNFIFCLSIQNNSIVFQRNDTVSVLTLDELLEENRNIMIFAMWSHDTLTIDCRAGNKAKRAEIPTVPTVPPRQLTTWARKHKLIPTQTYKTEEEFREKIYASLITINQKNTRSRCV